MALQMIGQAAKVETLRQLEQLGTKNLYIKFLPSASGEEAKSSWRGISVAAVDRLREGCAAIEQVACLSESKIEIGAAEHTISAQQVGCSANLATVLNLNIGKGRFISHLDIERSNRVCVLGENLAYRLGADGQPGKYIRMQDQLFRVIGVLQSVRWQEPKDAKVTIRNYNDAVMIPLGTETQMVITGNRLDSPAAQSGLTEIVVKARESKQVAAVGEVTKRIMQSSYPGWNGYQLVLPQELMLQAKKANRTFNIFLWCIAGISLLVGGIGIMNIMLATVTERTREIGIRRALGASARDIMTQFVAESVLLTCAGGGIGVLLGLIIVILVSRFAVWPLQLTLSAIVSPLIIAFVEGIVFGLYPAYLAAQKDPVDALRYE
jgi:putative ABC transport system permease protein